MPRHAVDAAGREEDRLEPELLDGATRFEHRAGDVVRCDHRRAVHAIGREVAHVFDVVVVRARDRGRELRLEAVGTDLVRRVEAEHEQAA